MRQKILSLFISFAVALLVSVLFTILLSEGNETSNGTTGTTSITNLGNPLKDDGIEGRGLNIWDLQVFDNKIYIGGGSIVDNTGPINVWAYSPLSQSFTSEYTVQEEAIERFKVFDKELYIPAADPVRGDDNKFYRRGKDGQWRLYTSDSVKLAHVRDLVKLNTGEILMVGNNRNLDEPTPGTALTTDDGISFQGAGIDDAPRFNFNYFFSIFKYKDRVYAINSSLREIFDRIGSIAVYNRELQKFETDLNLSNDEFIPRNQIEVGRNKNTDIIYQISNPIEFKETLVYSVRSQSIIQISNRQRYLNSLGMYVKQDLGITPIKVEFPDGHSVGEDILAIDNQLYALANKKKSDQDFNVYVYKTTDPVDRKKWQEVLHFNSKNKARSFEYLDNTFYFGLGQDYGEAIANSGDILSYQLN